eukprot:TRINITY_DN19279_c0_g1_i1.p1 TRINITY_DN19279_c0_g1~~TRINITY_DN19279_c0_g1_i1.p1  ORF type:complete len:330 (-),score=86.62 TRINITY_DN19279_c0_g1_i1:93-1082(-)
MGDKPKSKAFNRKPVDKRLVRQVMLGQKTPKYWVPMDISDTECKIMEVRKFSAAYFEVDAKFRRPGLELISAYAVQNPFLWGQYLLRREQLKMQLTGTGYTVKEKDFFYKSDFENFEKVCRQNFDLRYEQDPKVGVTFYSDALAANSSKPETENVRIIIMAKVLVGTCVKRVEEGATEVAVQSVSINNKTGLPIDTFTDNSQTVFFKFQMSEVYPEFLMVYRDTTAGPDTRMSKLPLEYCKVSYRSGTRINPQDERTIKIEDDPNKIEKVGVSFGPETMGKKPRLETQEAVTPKIPVRKIFSLKKKAKQTKSVSVSNNDIELGEKKTEE